METKTGTGAMTDFISLKDLNVSRWRQLLRVSEEVKRHPANFRQMLPGKSIVMLFEKASLRTRLTFELGIKQLGGEAVYLDYQDSHLGGRESLVDVAKNMERWFDCIVARTFSHQTVITLAEHGSIPVINALTDEEHPCQALADIFTLTEKWGDVAGKILAFVGDGNNVCASLIHAAALSGMSFVAITPATHKPYAGAEEDFKRLAASDSARYVWSDSLDALKGADAVYTDTWVSMGQEDEARARIEVFKAYQVTPEVMAMTGREAYFMHCLPAHRNQEVTDAVIDSEVSLVFEQAENRLHVQKALMLLLMAPRELDRYLHLDKWAGWS
ncbi:MAG TPA: ornithine carbamoyltransferase [Acidobacteriota bacterium]|nr:ornithine carbamoyltransferase [Acidobacteriota bacterium]